MESRGYVAAPTRWGHKVHIFMDQPHQREARFNLGYTIILCNKVKMERKTENTGQYWVPSLSELWLRGSLPVEEMMNTMKKPENMCLSCVREWKKVTSA